MLYEVRKMMYKVIDQVYEGDPKLSHYKKFYLTFEEKVSKTKGGVYKLDKKEIKIMGVGKKAASDFCLVALHELAHHIDHVQRGTTNHGKEFYQVYRKLIFGALNIKFVTVADVKWVVENGNYTDAKKVAQIIEEYSEAYAGKESGLTNGEVKVYVYNSYSLRELLGKRGYKYNGVDQSWVKIIPKWTLTKEKVFLLQRVSEKDIDVVEAGKVHIRPRIYVEVSGSTYQCRDILKDNGFSVVKKDKKWIWKKEVSDDTAQEILEDMQNKLCAFPYIQILIN